jgi:hypothetical protein
MATSANRFVHRTNVIDRLGRTVVYAGELLRHPVYTRFLHWMVGIFFFLALLSGFGIYLPWIFRFFTPLFGGGATTRFLHPWFGVGFVIFFGLQALNWLGVMRWTPADSRWMKLRLKMCCESLPNKGACWRAVFFPADSIASGATRRCCA